MSSGLPWWFSGEESTCQYRRREFDPWSAKIPHVSEQLSRCATTKINKIATNAGDTLVNNFSQKWKVLSQQYKVLCVPTSSILKTYLETALSRFHQYHFSPILSHFSFRFFQWPPNSSACLHSCPSPSCLPQAVLNTTVRDPARI